MDVKNAGLGLVHALPRIFHDGAPVVRERDLEGIAAKLKDAPVHAARDKLGEDQRIHATAKLKEEKGSSRESWDYRASSFSGFWLGALASVHCHVNPSRSSIYTAWIVADLR